jgi:hypothetical protein
MNKSSSEISKECKWDKTLEKYVPKASPLAYTLFVADKREDYHKENSKSEKQLSLKQIARKIRSDWKNCDESVKEKYSNLVAKANDRANKQKEEMAKKGYFTLTNGKKSSDIPPPAPKDAGKKRSMTPMKESKKGAMKKK